MIIEEYIEKVKQYIQSKNNKNYRNKCENVELVINDAEKFFYDKDILMLNKFLKNKELLNLVKHSIFRVVYIITKYSEHYKTQTKKTRSIKNSEVCVFGIKSLLSLT